MYVLSLRYFWYNDKKWCKFWKTITLHFSSTSQQYQIQLENKLTAGNTTGIKQEQAAHKLNTSYTSVSTLYLYRNDRKHNNRNEFNKAKN